MSLIGDYIGEIVCIVMITVVPVLVYICSRHVAPEAPKANARTAALIFFTMMFVAALLVKIVFTIERWRYWHSIDVILAIVYMIFGFVAGYLWWKVYSRCGVSRCT